VKVWNPYLRQDIETPEKLQRRATKLMIRNRNICYQDRLRMLGLTPLETWRLKNLMI